MAPRRRALFFLILPLWAPDFLVGGQTGMSYYEHQESPPPLSSGGTPQHPVDWTGPDDDRIDCSREPDHASVVVTLLIIYPGADVVPHSPTGKYNNLTGGEFVGFNKEHALTCTVLAQREALAKTYSGVDYLVLYDGIDNEAVRRLCGLGILMRPLLRLPPGLNVTTTTVPRLCEARGLPIPCDIGPGPSANIRKLHVLGLTEWDKAMFVDLDLYPLSALVAGPEEWLAKEEVEGRAPPASAVAQEAAAAATPDPKRQPKASLMGMLDLDGRELVGMQRRADRWYERGPSGGLWGKRVRCVQRQPASSGSNGRGSRGTGVDFGNDPGKCRVDGGRVDMVCVAGGTGRAPCHGANFAVRPSRKAFLAALSVALNGTYSPYYGWRLPGDQAAPAGLIPGGLAVGGWRTWDFVGGHVDQGLLFWVGAYVLGSYALVGSQSPRQKDLRVQHAAGGAKPWKLETYEAHGYSHKKRELPWHVFWGDDANSGMRGIITRGGLGGGSGGRPRAGAHGNGTRSDPIVPANKEGGVEEGLDVMACIADYRELYARRSHWGAPWRLRDDKRKCNGTAPPQAPPGMKPWQHCGY